jgi:glycosyltransferase involved in cell wall biosynthesis
MYISIIIPTFNRADLLASTINSIFSKSTSSVVFEVIVIDNGSTDTTKEVCSTYEKKHSNFSYFFDATPGLLTGRHKGAEEAKGEILTFIDDDVIVSSEWLQTIADTMYNKPNIMFLTGPNLPLYESYPPEWLNYFWSNNEYGKECGWLSLIDFGTTIQEIHPRYVWGLNYTIRKTAFEQLGGFHPDNISKAFQHFQGDGESGLCIKGVEQNMKALYHPGAMVYHQIPNTRLTYEYFDNRAYYQGVCDSYTNFRKQEGLYKKIANSNPRNLFGRVKNIVSYKLQKIKNSYNKKETIPNEIQLLFQRFEQKRIEGYNFHQQAFTQNNDVREWVLKQDYFNYQLPSTKI